MLIIIGALLIISIFYFMIIAALKSMQAVRFGNNVTYLNGNGDLKDNQVEGILEVGKDAITFKEEFGKKVYFKIPLSAIINATSKVRGGAGPALYPVPVRIYLDLEYVDDKKNKNTLSFSTRSIALDKKLKEVITFSPK